MPPVVLCIVEMSALQSERIEVPGWESCYVPAAATSSAMYAERCGKVKSMRRASYTWSGAWTAIAAADVEVVVLEIKFARLPCCLKEP